MKKEELARTLVLLGILAVALSVSFHYDNSTSGNDFPYYPEYHHGVTVRYYPDYDENCYYKETIELLPPDWLLELYNVSANESFNP